MPRSKSRPHSRRTRRTKSRKTSRKRSYRGSGYDEPYGMSWFKRKTSKQIKEESARKLEVQRLKDAKRIHETRGREIRAEHATQSKSLEAGRVGAVKELTSALAQGSLLSSKIVLMDKVATFVKTVPKRVAFMGRVNSGQKVTIVYHELEDPRDDLTWYMWDMEEAKLFPNVKSTQTTYDISYPPMKMVRRYRAEYDAPVWKSEFKAFLEDIYPYQSKDWKEIKDVILQTCTDQNGKVNYHNCDAFPACDKINAAGCIDPVHLGDAGEVRPGEETGRADGLKVTPFMKTTRL